MRFFLFQLQSQVWMGGKSLKCLFQRILMSWSEFKLPIEIPQYGDPILTNGNRKDGWTPCQKLLLVLVFLAFIPICELYRNICHGRLTKKMNSQDDFHWGRQGVHVSMIILHCFDPYIDSSNYVSGFKFAQLQISKQISLLKIMLLTFHFLWL